MSGAVRHLHGDRQHQRVPDRDGPLHDIPLRDAAVTDAEIGHKLHPILLVQREVLDDPQEGLLRGAASLQTETVEHRRRVAERHQLSLAERQHTRHGFMTRKGRSNEKLLVAESFRLVTNNLVV